MKSEHRIKRRMRKKIGKAKRMRTMKRIRVITRENGESIRTKSISYAALVTGYQDSS